MNRIEDRSGEMVKTRFQDFLEKFDSTKILNGEEEEEEGEDQVETRDYRRCCNFMVENETTTMYVDMIHLQNHDDILYTKIKDDYYRFEPFLRKAVQNFVNHHYPDYVNSGSDANNEGREFFISFYNSPSIMKLRDLRTDKIGKLCAIAGTVTRTSEVRPELLFGTFKCTVCGLEAKNVEQQFKFTEPTACRGLFHFFNNLFYNSNFHYLNI